MFAPNVVDGPSYEYIHCLIHRPSIDFGGSTTDQVALDDEYVPF